jgi:hypothetical protein
METVIGCCGAWSKIWPKVTQLSANLIHIPLNANHISPDIKTNCQSETTAVRYGQNMGFWDIQSFPVLNVRFLKSCQTPLRVMLNLSRHVVLGQKVSLIQKFISIGFWFTKTHLICIKDFVTIIYFLIVKLYNCWELTMDHFTAGVWQIISLFPAVKFLLFFFFFY